MQEIAAGTSALAMTGNSNVIARSVSDEAIPAVRNFTPSLRGALATKQSGREKLHPVIARSVSDEAIQAGRNFTPSLRGALATKQSHA